MSDMDTVAREWLTARNIIARFLVELDPRMSRLHEEGYSTIAEHNAAAIIARLAGNDPPILLNFIEEE